MHDLTRLNPTVGCFACTTEKSAFKTLLRLLVGGQVVMRIVFGQDPLATIVQDDDGIDGVETDGHCIHGHSRGL